MDKDEPKDIVLKHPKYQPTKAELEEDLRVDTTFEELADVVVKPVRIQYVMPE